MFSKKNALLCEFLYFIALQKHMQVLINPFGHLCCSFIRKRDDQNILETEPFAFGFVEVVFGELIDDGAVAFGECIGLSCACTCRHDPVG